MAKHKTISQFSQDFLDLDKKLAKGLKMVSRKLAADIKKNNSYLIVSKNGKLIKLFAKDL